MKKTFFASSLCLLITGWGIKLPVLPVSAETPTAIKQLSAPTSAQTRVELLNPGAEPKQELRFKPTVNVKQKSNINMKIDTEISVGGEKIPAIDSPAIAMEVETTVTKVDENGDIHYEFFYTKADAVSNGTSRPEALEAMRSQIKKIVGLKGNVIVDDRGRPKSTNFIFPEGTSETFKQAIAQVTNVAERVNAPVPEEAIGTGAKWRVSNSLNLSGISLTQTTTYELVNLQDNVATIKISVEQNAGTQNVTVPGMPSGNSLVLKSMNSQGQGEIGVRLDRVMPMTSTLSMLSNTEGSIKEPNTNTEMIVSTKLSMQMSIESD